MGQRCANLVHVKPYVFFAGTADINAPPSSHRRNDSRKPQIPQSNSRPFKIRPQQQRFVQTAPHEGKADNSVTAAVDNSNNNNNTSGKERESEGQGEEENESSSSSSSESSSSDSGSSSSGEESEVEGTSQGDATKQQQVAVSTAGIEDCQTAHPGCPPSALEEHTSGRKESATTHPVSDTHATQPTPGTHTTQPDLGTSSRPKIEDPDKFLLSLEKILQQIHTTFYTEYDSVKQTSTIGNVDRRGSHGDDIPTPDLKEIIPRFRKSVLQGARLVFTGVIPTNMPMERSREWNTARAFGAVVQTQLIPGRGSTKADITSEATTHLIVGRPATNKHRQALKMKGLKVVNSKWLWACAEQWQWVDETLFAPDFPSEGATKTKLTKEKREQGDSEHHQVEGGSTTRGNEGGSDPGLNVLQMGAGGSQHRSHRFSVSSEELEKMEAEINRELSIEEEEEDDDDEEESGEEEDDLSNVDRLGSYIGKDNQNESMDTFEDYLGLATSDTFQLSRKRKHDEVDISSSNSNSPEDHSQSVRVSEDEEEDDELADLLGL